MLLFSFPHYINMAEDILDDGVTLGDFEIKRFGDGEMCAHIKSDIKGQTCFILGTISPPDENLLGLLILAHTLKKDGAGKVVAILPYMAYTRQDKDKPGEAMTTDLLGSMLKASGIDKVVTVTMHSKKGIELIGLPFDNLSPIDLCAKELKNICDEKTTLIAPDEGAVPQCNLYNEAIGLKRSIVYCKKTRNHEGITQTDPIGELSEHALIIDDMLSTGGTLVSTCRHLKKLGVKKIDVFVVHGIFAGDKWKELWDAGVTNIWCTNSIPSAFQPSDPRIKHVSLMQILKNSMHV